MCVQMSIRYTAAIIVPDNVSFFLYCCMRHYSFILLQCTTAILLHTTIYIESIKLQQYKIVYSVVQKSVNQNVAVQLQLLHSLFLAKLHLL